ncbi:MAG: HAD family hydrolase [Euryarchaeota archaeon]|nr:HAD family hydrolase [Euryarchaeota archaeon]MDE1835250.1 HAD family hydrolase [Euryarchaeota archaeon]MDE1881088.1 HAD family hydrolase [Euryarchaeota archaeon]MDE2043546.1 HAD family hydrolase [Thermoplasmata archaeon]
MSRDCRDGGRHGAGAPIQGVTVDFWHTLAYLPERPRQRLEEERRSIWTRHLVRGGLPSRQAPRWVRWWEKLDYRLERLGRAPSIPAQCRLVGRAAAIRLRSLELQQDLDAALLAAPVRRVPGAREALRRLEGVGVRIALLSNVVFETPVAARALLAKLDLAKELPVRVYSAEHPWSKPDPRIYRCAMHKLRLRPSQGLHVGDLSLDVEGALAAGMSVLRLTWEERHRGIARLPGRWDVPTWSAASRWILARASPRDERGAGA